MLDMWAKCLKELGNLREFISVALRAISCAFGQPPLLLVSQWSLTELIECSKHVNELITVPLEHYFMAWSLGPYVSHWVDSDGFGLELRIQCLVSESFQAASVSVQITSAVEGKQDSIWLSCESGTAIKPGFNKVSLTSKVKI